MVKENNHIYKLILIMVLLFLVTPILSTLIYSISTEWDSTMLPAGFTFKWYKFLLVDNRFLYAIIRSIFICIITLIISMVIIVPSIFIVNYYFPKYEKYLKIIAITPFTIPLIVRSVGLMRFFSKGPIVLVGTIYLLIGAYIMIVLPYIYRAIKNSLDSINMKDLMEAANVLGANNFQSFTMVILPNLKTGITISSLLGFVYLFSEFTLANVLIGARYEVVQVFLYNMRHESGHYSSALVVIYFVVILLVSTSIFKLTNTSKKSKRS